MMVGKQKKFSITFDALNEMLDFVLRCALEQGFNSELLKKVRLASDEALTNIISHSGLENHNYLEICCSSLPDKPGIEITIKDPGIPYNPLERDIEKQALSEDKPIGGYGVFLILKLMDKVEYQRENNNNVLTLVKYLTC